MTEIVIKSTIKTYQHMEIIAYLKPTCGWSNGVRAIMKKVRPYISGKRHHQ